MAGAGYTETWNPALVDGRKLEELRISAQAMRVQNALSDDMDTLRTSLLPSLVDVVARNRDRGRVEVRVYEVAEAYLARVGEKNAQPEEPLRIAAVASAGMSADRPDLLDQHHGHHLRQQRRRQLLQFGNGWVRHGND